MQLSLEGVGHLQIEVAAHEPAYVLRGGGARDAGIGEYQETVVPPAVIGGPPEVPIVPTSTPGIGAPGVPLPPLDALQQYPIAQTPFSPMGAYPYPYPAMQPAPLAFGGLDAPAFMPQRFQYPMQVPMAGPPWQNPTQPLHFNQPMAPMFVGQQQGIGYRYAPMQMFPPAQPGFFNVCGPRVGAPFAFAQQMEAMSYFDPAAARTIY